MPVKSKIGSFQIGTGAAGTTVAVTGIGFVPKAIVFFGSGRTAVGSVRGDPAATIAFVCTGIQTANIGWAEDDGAATSANRSVASLTSTLSPQQPVAGDYGVATVTSLDADGFTLTINTQFVASNYYNYLCIGGEDIESVNIGTFTIPTTATTKAITGLGFKPDCLFFMGNSEPGLGGSDMSVSFGVATRLRAQNGGIAAEAENGLATTNCNYYQRNGDCLPAFNGAGALSQHGTVQSFDSDGFTISMSEVSGTAYNWYYLAIKGGSYHLGNQTTPTDTSTTKTTSGFGFLPRAILFFGCENAECANDTPVADCAISIGARDSSGTSTVMQFESYDNLADAACVESQRSDGVIIDTDSGAGLEVLATIPSLGINGFTELNSNHTPGVGTFFFYLAIGDTSPNGIHTDMWI